MDVIDCIEFAVKLPGIEAIVFGIPLLNITCTIIVHSVAIGCGVRAAYVEGCVEAFLDAAWKLIDNLIP